MRVQNEGREDKEIENLWMSKDWLKEGESIVVTKRIMSPIIPINCLKAAGPSSLFSFALISPGTAWVTERLCSY